LLFLQPFLKSGQLNDAVRKLYKGALRGLLMLLHHFPEFLSDYNLSFCELIPASCVQLRNLVLSAFPRSMRLPDRGGHNGLTLARRSGAAGRTFPVEDTMASPSRVAEVHLDADVHLPEEDTMASPSYVAEVGKPYIFFKNRTNAR
jgi:hypothetical protein